MTKNTLLRLAVMVLGATAICSPLQAGTYQYNVYVKGLQGSVSEPGLPTSSALTGGPPLDFGIVHVPSAELAVQPFLFSNTGSIAAEGLQLSISDPAYVISTSNCGTTLLPGADCGGVVAFKPSQVGSAQAMLTASTTNGASAVTNLSGAATDGQLVASTGSVNFENTAVDTYASEKTISFKNIGDGAIAVSPVSLIDPNNEFSTATDCTGSIDAYSGCTVTVGFKPEAVGTRTAALKFGAQGQTSLTIKLGGAGKLPVLELSPNTLNFSKVALGSSSTQQVQILNPASKSVSVSNISTTKGSTDFGQSNNCGSEIPAGGSCTLAVQMTPSQLGPLAGTISISSDLGTSTLPLSGLGGQPDITISDDSGYSATLSTAAYPITFADTPVFQSGAIRTLTLTNKGPAQFHFSGIGLVNGAAQFGQSNNCGGFLDAGASCAILLMFTPSEGGAQSGLLVLSTEFGDYSVHLSGTGVQAAGYWRAETTSSFGTIVPGTSVSRTFTFTNTVASAPIYAEIVGADLLLSKNTCGTKDAPSTLDIKETCSVDVSYSPTSVSQLTGAFIRASSSMFAAPITMNLTGYAANYSLAFDLTPASDFGLMKAGTTLSRAFVLRNASKITDTIADAPSVSGSGFTISSNGCRAGVELAPNATCTIGIVATAQLVQDLGTYALEGELVVPSLGGVVASLPLRATYTQEGYGLEWVSSGDFGTLQPGASTSRSLTLKNTSQSNQVLDSSVTYSGNGYQVSLNNCTAGLKLAVNSSCQVTLVVRAAANLAPGDYALDGSLTATTTQGGVVELGLSAQFTQGEYTLDLSEPLNGDYGTLKVGGSSTHALTLTNTSDYTQVIASLALSSTNGFSIYSKTCTEGAALASKSSCSIQIRASAATGTSAGTHYLSSGLIATTKQGGSAELPLAAQYEQEDYSLVWSGTSDYGSIRPGLSLTKTFTLTNTSKSNQTILVLPFVDSTDFTVGSSSCTKTDALKPGGTCSVQVTAKTKAGQAEGSYGGYSTLSVTNSQGIVAQIPLSFSYTQEPYVLAIVGSGDFATLKTSGSLTKSFTIRNKSTYSNITLSAIPAVSATPFRLVANSCTKGLVLAPSDYCSVSVSVTAAAGQPSGDYSFNEVLTITSNQGPAIEVPLTMNYSQERYTLTLTGNGDYGVVKAGGTASRQFTVTNTSASNETLVSPSIQGFTLAAGTCGSRTILAPKATCFFNVSVQGIAGSAQYGSATIANTQGESATINLSATTP